MARTTTIGSTLAAARSQAERDQANIAEAVQLDAQGREDYMSSGLPPDWLTSGIAGAGIGWLFGPIGGVLGWLLSNQVSEGRREAIAMQAADDAETARKLIDGGAATLERLEGLVETDQERVELDALRTQYENAVALASHRNPQVAAEGFSALQAIPGLVDDEADEIEAERIRVSDLERAEQQTFFDRADNIRGDNVRESSRYVATVEAWQRMSELQSQGTSASDISLIYALANLNDPGAIVTDGDISTLESVGSISEQALALYNRVLKGEGNLTPTQRAELVNTGRAIVQTQVAQQIERNDLAVDRARLAGLPIEYQQTVVVPVSDALRTSVVQPPGSTVGDQRDAPVERIPVNGQDRSLRAERPGVIAQGVAGIGMFARETAGDLARIAEDQTVYTDTDTGERFVMDANGEVVEELEPLRYFRNEAGEQIERVHTPNGPVFRNRTRETAMRNNFEGSPELVFDALGFRIWRDPGERRETNE